MDEEARPVRPKRIHQNSRNAWREIKERGILGGQHRLIFWCLLKHGPSTATEVFEIMKDRGMEARQYRARFNELREQKVVYEMDSVTCRVTGKKVILWDLTGRLPIIPYKVREYILRIAVDPEADTWGCSVGLQDVRADLRAAIRKTNRKALVGLCLQERTRTASPVEKRRATKRGFDTRGTPKKGDSP